MKLLILSIIAVVVEILSTEYLIFGQTCSRQGQIEEFRSVCGPRIDENIENMTIATHM